MTHYLDRFINAMITVERITEDPVDDGAFGPEPSGPTIIHQDLLVYLSKKNGTKGFLEGKNLGTDNYQILIKKSLVETTPLNDEKDTVIVTEYMGDPNHPHTGRYRIDEYDPERSSAIRPNAHAKLFLTRIKSVDDK